VWTKDTIIYAILHCRCRIVIQLLFNFVYLFFLFYLISIFRIFKECSGAKNTFTSCTHYITVVKYLLFQTNDIRS